MQGVVHEGYVLKIFDETLWLVKWNIHDNNKNVIALPWKHRAKDLHFVDSINYVKLKYPYFMKVVKSYNRILPVISREHVRKIFNPYKEVVRIVKEPKNYERTVRDLIMLITSEAGVDINNVGVVYGSELEPIIISKGKSVAFKIYNAVRRLFFTTNMFYHLEPGMFFNIEKHDIYVKISDKVLKSLYSRKYLSGVFSTVPYTIRLLDDLTYDFSDIEVKSYGRVTLIAKIINDKYSIFYPSRYSVLVTSIAEGSFRAKFVSEIVAFNEGFREAAWEGAEVLVQGTLEKVVDNVCDREYYRVTVGFSKDLILPLQRQHIPLYA